MWQEYEEGKTEDAKLAKELDQIEMVNCATSIELSHPKLKEDLDAFWAYADKKIATRKGRELFNEAVGNREAMTAGKESTSEVYKKVYLSPVA